MKSRLIALDIDGTILDMPAGVSVPAAVRDAVMEAREEGARVCLCSSRPCFFMDDATKDLGEIDAMVGCSGAAIETLSTAAKIRKQIFKDTLSADIVNTCIEAARSWDVYVSFGGDEKILARTKGPVEPELAANPLFCFLEERELMEVLRTAPVSCGFVFMMPEVPESAVLEMFASSGATANKSSQDSIIITNKGVDKGTGVLRLAEHFGIPREAILAVGNDENDISMLKAAGVGVAVANASPQTLAAADWIAPDVRHAGAAEAIRRFAL